MARMFNPPHPGLTLRDDVLPALGVGVSEAAGQLGISRVALSRVLNGRAAISPELALRLEAWLGVDRGGDAQVWLAEQGAYDLSQAEQVLKNKPQFFVGFPEVMQCAESEAIAEHAEWLEVTYAVSQVTRQAIASASTSARTQLATNGVPPRGNSVIAESATTAQVFAKIERA
jgi:addiction module HigA family antidote